MIVIISLKRIIIHFVFLDFTYCYKKRIFIYKIFKEAIHKEK